MSIFLSVLTGIVCIISFLLLLMDREKWNAEKEPEEKNPARAETIPVSVWVYSAVCTVILIATAALFPRLYPGNSVWVNIKRMCLLAIIWPVAYIDFKTYRIPNIFILLGIICRAIIFVFELLLDNPAIWPSLISEAVAAGALLLASLLCAVVVKNGIGFGDMKLFVIMGLMLGLEGIWGAIFISLFISFLIALVLLLFKKKSRKDAIPFGPALVLGTFLSVTLSGM